MALRARWVAALAMVLVIVAVGATEVRRPAHPGATQPLNVVSAPVPDPPPARAEIASAAVPAAAISDDAPGGSSWTDDRWGDPPPASNSLEDKAAELDGMSAAAGRSAALP